MHQQNNVNVFVRNLTMTIDYQSVLYSSFVHAFSWMHNSGKIFCFM